MKHSLISPQTIIKKKNVYFTIILIFFIAATLSTRSVAETIHKNKKINMAATRHEDSYDGKAIKLIYTEAFKRLGLELVYSFYPPKRASMMAKLGQIDGELARIYNYNQNLPNLIRVDEPVSSVKISAFTTDPAIKLNGWESLRGTDYKVEYMRGVKLCAIKLSKVVNKKNLSEIAHWSQGLKKIIAKRTDIYVEVERTVLRELKKDDFKNANMRIAGVMEEVNLYTFLNKKYADLVPQLAEILKKMKEDGTIKNFLDSVENKVD